MQTPTLTRAAMWNCIHILDFQENDVSCLYPQKARQVLLYITVKENYRMKHRAMTHRDTLPKSCSVSPRDNAGWHRNKA